ncbi:MAG: Spi family protease inhibitor, partial [Prevotella sp.]|nr:Spi family protease inhibitor [Prevotella sp.]
MSNRITSLIFCLLSFTIAFANPIDQQDALAKAKAFVQERGINMSLNGRHTIKAPSSNGEDDNVGYYIFNSANDQGFVIVSGYDCVYPILGYSDKGHIDTDNMPDALKAMLDDYAFKGDSIYQIEKRLMETGEQPSGIKRVFSPARYPVKPFLRRNWSYNAPYNKKLPTINDTTCNVGCTSVAVSTIIGHYSYPASSKAINGYTTTTRKIVVDPLPDINFDWDNILDNYGLEPGTTQQQNAVAQLVRYVSQSL